MSDIKKRIIQFLGDNIAEEAIAAAQDNIPFLKQSELLGGKAYNRAIASYLFFSLVGYPPRRKGENLPKGKETKSQNKGKIGVFFDSFWDFKSIKNRIFYIAGMES